MNATRRLGYAHQHLEDFELKLRLAETQRRLDPAVESVMRSLGNAVRQVLLVVAEIAREGEDEDVSEGD